MHGAYTSPLKLLCMPCAQHWLLLVVAYEPLYFHPEGMCYKYQGVRPIGIGYVPRWIIAKAVWQIIGLDTEEAAGPLQVCAGQEGRMCGCSTYYVKHLSEPRHRGCFVGGCI